MKPLALSLAISANLVAVFSFGQITYSHYLDETSQWHVKQTSVYFNGSCNPYVLEVRHFTLFFDGDTMFNGQGYYKLFASRNDSIICGNSFTLANSTQYIAAIREDSTKRVYFRTGSGDQLLWNFNISIGDLIGNNFCLVSNIDTVWLGNSPLQRYLCNCGVNNSMVEGVGLSPIIPLSSLCTMGVESSLRLICYSKQNHTLQFDSYNSCNLQPVTSLAPVEKSQSGQVDIFPNPAQDEIFLRLHTPLGEAPVRIRLINAMGQTVLSVQGTGAMHRLDISALPKGLYFVEAVSAGAHIAKQVIKR